MERTPNLRTFEVSVRDEGKSPIVETVKAFSPQELISQYELMGYEKGQVRILREIKTVKPIQKSTKKINPTILTNDTGVIPLLNVTDLPEKVQDIVPSDIYSNNTHSESSNSTIIEKTKEEQPIKSEEKSDVSYWKDGNIEFKLENGKLFKRVWSSIDLNYLMENFNIRLKDSDGGIPDNINYDIEILEWSPINQGI